MNDDYIVKEAIRKVQKYLAKYKKQNDSKIEYKVNADYVNNITFLLNLLKYGYEENKEQIAHMILYLKL